MNRKPRKTVGLIGLGIIGSRAAAGLRAAGFQTYVWNRTPQPAPNFLATPGDVAASADILQLFVADAQALFDVLAAMRDRLTAQHLVIASGTFGPEATVEASEYVKQTGAHFLDAPFTGSKGAAEKRQLVYYLGGDDADVLRAKPVLEATSRAIVRIGRVGDAAIVKVVTNMIAAVSIQALAEALAIVRKAGLSDDVLGAALENNACRNGTMELKLPKMISGDYEPHFSLKHMFKDVQLGIQMANALDLDVPAASVTAGAMFGGIKHGWADLDFAALFKVYENLRGHHHSLEAPPAAPASLGLESTEMPDAPKSEEGGAPTESTETKLESPAASMEADKTGDAAPAPTVAEEKPAEGKAETKKRSKGGGGGSSVEKKPEVGTAENDSPAAPPEQNGATPKPSGEEDAEKPVSPAETNPQAS